MFENSSLYAMMNDGKIKKFRMTKTFFESRIFFKNLFNRYEGYAKAPYIYGYKNEYNELSYVENFQIERKIIEAIKDPSAINEIITASNDEMEKIKFVFMGKVNEENGVQNSVVLFQKIQKTQVISNGKGLKVIADGNTFSVFTQNLLSVLDRLDCYYVNGILNFNSIYFARQIFDMSLYIVEATEDDIESFAANPIFAPESTEAIKNIKNQNFRNKIKNISDSGILKQHNAKSISEVSQRIGLDIEIRTTDNDDSVIVIPTETKDLKKFFKILDETVYEGLLSRQLKESNSSKPFDR